MTIPLKALIVEDVASDADLLLRNLKKDGFSVIFRRVETELEMKAALTTEAWDIILSDCSFPAFSGMAGLELVKILNLDIPVIIISGTIGEENAIDLMQAGAKDIIYKSKMRRLGQVIERELEDLAVRKKEKIYLNELTKSEDKFRILVETMPAGMWVIDALGKTTFSNHFMAKMLGYSSEQMLGRSFMDFMDEEGRQKAAYYLERRARGIKEQHEFCFISKNGTKIFTNLYTFPQMNVGRNYTGAIAIATDITSQRIKERELHNTLNILKILNENTSLKQIAESIINEIVNMTGFDAVGIRLKDGNDFPYIFQKGFSKEFLNTENSLVSKSKSGVICRDENGNISLECTCGLVISGKTDSKNPLFTENGSAWNNNSTSLLDLTAKEDPRRNPRNRCVYEGYLSLAIIPIRADKEIIGMLQLNDKKKDRLTLEFVKYFESLCNIMGIGLRKCMAEEKTIVSESKYRSLFNNSNISVILADANTGEIIDVNKDAEILFGRNRDELIGLNRIELHPKKESDYYKNQFLRHVEQHGVSTEQAQIVKKDGTLVNVLISSSLIELNGQTVIQGIFQDITDIFNAKEKQKQSEEKYQNLFEHISSAIIVVDVETDRIIEVNEYAEILFGRIRSELVGLNWFDLHYKKQADDYIPRFKNHIKFSKVLNEEIVVLKKDGTRSYMLLSVNKLEIDRVKVFRLIFNDNTAAKKAEESLELSRENLEKALYSTVEALASTVEAKDPYTAGHQRRVSFLSAAIALEMGYSENRIRLVKTAATVHDIGKIQVPTEILSKPGKINKIEFEFIKTHVQASYDILSKIEFPWPIADIVYQHHERINGTGYPRGLKGDEILPETKIITVADVIEAITSHRPYRDALGIDIALEEIQNNRGIFYDPIVVDACTKLFKEKDFHFVGGGVINNLTDTRLNAACSLLS